MALAYAVFVAGVLQLLFQLPFLARIHALPRPRWAPRHEGVRRALRTLRRNPLPTSIGALAIVVIALLLTLFKPPPPPAYLDIRLVRPQTALIYVNGVDVTEGFEGGLRGLEGHELTPGEHTIRCEADGYIAFEDTFRAQPGQTVSYSVSMDMTPELLQEISKRFREQPDPPVEDDDE